MNNDDVKKQGHVVPGVYRSETTSNLKTIANKSPEAYGNNVPEETAADLKRKNAEAEMAASPFRAQPFISPITGRTESSGNVNVVMAHGVYDKSTDRVVRFKEPIVLTEEAMAKATFTMTTNVSKLLAQNAIEESVSVPIQGRLVFSTTEGEFEIAANLVRVRLEDSDVYAQYDRTLHDVLDEQFGKFKGPKPFTRVVKAPELTLKHGEEDQDVALGMTTILDEATPKQQGDVTSAETTLAPKKEAPLRLLDEAASNSHSKYEPKHPALAPQAYYEVPSLDLLEASQARQADDDEWIEQKMSILEATFENFGVAVTVTGNYIQGATVTQFEVMPAPGTKVSRIMNLANDLKLSLSVDDLRIEQIQGKSTIGIEIANENRRIVRLKDVLSSPEFVLHESPLYIGLGEDIKGASVYTDILTMPHGLIAGQTGSGKSVCINTILVSILCKAKPEDVRLMLIDPKRVEMAPYNDIPHLVTPVITDEKKAATALVWAVEEMERRYEMFAKNGVRDIKTFNRKRSEFTSAYGALPYIVIIIDELADLMMVAGAEVEDCILRLTQKARAAGLHLIVATQRPTVNVVTGTIKSNIPSRIAFAVAQANDSRVILDENGAENLLGYGDMLLSENGAKTIRLQGSFVDDEEVARVVEAAKSQGAPNYLIAEDALERRIDTGESSEDALEQEALALFVERQTASTSLLQRTFRIGYNRAARIIDDLEAKGWISAPMGATSKRDVLVSKSQLQDLVVEGSKR